MIDRFLGDAFGVLSCQFWSTVLQYGVRLSIHTLNYWTVSVSKCPFSKSGAVFKMGVCLSVTFLAVDLWQYLYAV